MNAHRWDHHPTCPCGCDELADECAGPHQNPLGSLRIDAPERAVRIHLYEEDPDQ